VRVERHKIMPALLVKEAPCGRLEVCSGVQEANEEGFRPGSLLPIGDWRLVGDTEPVAAWDLYHGDRCLHENIALVHVIGARFVSKVSLRQVVLDRLEAVCHQLCAGAPVEHRGRWLAKGGGTSLSTTIDRSDGKRIGLHIDQWERQPLASVRSARNRLCLNMGPGARYLVFVAVDLWDIAASCGVAPTNPFTTRKAQVYLRQHPMTNVYRLRIEPGEAYIASTECLIHDGQASSVAGEWVYTVFGRFEATGQARSLSVV
jgi:hypothetical protein